MEENKKKSIIVSIAIVVIITVVLTCIYQGNIFERKGVRLEKTNGTTVVPTMLDELTADSTWCGTFQLIWNDLKNEVAKRDIVFTPQEVMADNLNKESFTEDMLSDEYYYKVYGLKTIELKEEIERAIKEKFNQKSDILDKFDWSEDALNDPNDPNTNRYFFYTMLYREFEFIKVFDRLDDGKFGIYSGIKYFGIDPYTNDDVGEQIEVLYYNSQNDFAVILNTKSNDEVIFVKNPQGTTFKEIYEDMLSQATDYTGDRGFNDIDEFKAPLLTYNEEREYTELQGKYFPTALGTGIIIKTIQTIQFELNEKGGKIKSEAGMDMMDTASIEIGKKPVPRYFYVDDTFAIFLREKGMSMPYFAGRVEDITKYQ